MPIYKGTVLQSGADTTTRFTIPTGLTVDGKTAWNITGFETFWSNASSAVAADWNLEAELSTLNTGTSYSSYDEIARVSWAVQNTAGVAVALPVEPIKSANLFEDRITAQPNLYVAIESAATGQANRVYFTVVYDIVKLSDVELLRLMVGGA
jgi:hypothetical protein